MYICEKYVYSRHFLISNYLLTLHCSESTKQMEQTLGAKVKIFFNSENLKKWF